MFCGDVEAAAHCVGVSSHSSFEAKKMQMFFPRRFTFDLQPFSGVCACARACARFFYLERHNTQNDIQLDRTEASDPSALAVRVARGYDLNL